FRPRLSGRGVARHPVLDAVYAGVVQPVLLGLSPVVHLPEAGGVSADVERDVVLLPDGADGVLPGAGEGVAEDEDALVAPSNRDVLPRTWWAVDGGVEVGIEWAGGQEEDDLRPAPVCVGFYYEGARRIEPNADEGKPVRLKLSTCLGTVPLKDEVAVAVERGVAGHLAAEDVAGEVDVVLPRIADMEGVVPPRRRGVGRGTGALKEGPERRQPLGLGGGE